MVPPLPHRTRAAPFFSSRAGAPRTTATATDTPPLSWAVSDDGRVDQRAEMRSTPLLRTPTHTPHTHTHTHTRHCPLNPTSTPITLTPAHWRACASPPAGHHKSCDNNVILYPGIDSRSSAGWNRQCQTDDNGVFANQYHHHNYCVTSTNALYSFSNCNSGNVNTTAYHTYGNKLFTPDGSFNVCGVNSWSRWQTLGQDAGSSIGTTPSIAEMIAAAQAVLSP